MIGLDTNVLIRYLTRDDERQWQQAAELIEGEQQCFIDRASSRLQRNGNVRPEA